MFLRRLSFLVVLAYLSCSAACLPTVDVQVDWTEPDMRENGTQLFIWEIDHYDVCSEGEQGETCYEALGEDTSFVYAESYGEHKIKMRTVDIAGLTSEWTEPVDILVSE